MDFLLNDQAFSRLKIFLEFLRMSQVTPHLQYFSDVLKFCLEFLLSLSFSVFGNLTKIMKAKLNLNLMTISFEMELTNIFADKNYGR